MYTITKIEQISVEQPSSWTLSTQEEFEIIVQYRFGFMIIQVNDEILHKQRINPEITSSKMSTEEMLTYIKQELPEELLDLSTIKIKTK
jgi:hypothetical protein